MLLCCCSFFASSAWTRLLSLAFISLSGAMRKLLSTLFRSFCSIQSVDAHCNNNSLDWHLMRPHEKVVRWKYLARRHSKGKMFVIQHIHRQTNTFEWLKHIRTISHSFLSFFLHLLCIEHCSMNSGTSVDGKVAAMKKRRGENQRPASKAIISSIMIAITVIITYD